MEEIRDLVSSSMACTLYSSSMAASLCQWEFKEVEMSCRTFNEEHSVLLKNNSGIFSLEFFEVEIGG
jgi:hypothetical protein